MVKLYHAEVEGTWVCEEPVGTLEAIKGEITQYLEGNSETSGHATIYEVVPILEGRVQLTADWKPVKR